MGIQKRRRTERRFDGVAVSPGVVRARVSVVVDRFEPPESRTIGNRTVESELERFEAALRRTRSQILEMQLKITDEVGSRDASIFDAHLLMLEDRTVLDEVVRRLREKPRRIEAVFYDVVKRYMDSLRRIDDPYLKERVVDIEDVARRVIRNLVEEERDVEERTGGLQILVAHDLTPSDTATIDRSRVLGFATEVGSQTSHTAIMARSLGIPAVVAIRGICRLLRDGEEIILDGYNGTLIASPSPETGEHYDALAREKASTTAVLEELRDTRCRTADGKDIILSANIELEEELEFVTKTGADGIGLYRTEFLYLREPQLPSEDEQAAVYTRVAQATGDSGVIIRTFDVGGDKLQRGGGEEVCEVEPNPFLGWRGIRVSLDRRDVFRTQLRAILRASGQGKVGVMFPMVSGVREILEARAVLAECMTELREEGVAFDPDLQTGAMIEVPAAAMIAELIAPHVDFFSIGTNDLIQYTLAVDRINERVANLYEPAHPAVLRLLRRIVEAAKGSGIWSGVCGEMAGDILYTPLMVGLGLDELSVGAGQLLRVKHAIRSLDSVACTQLVEELSGLADPAEIAARCRQMAEQCYPDLLS